MMGDAVVCNAVAGKIPSIGGSPDYQESYATSNAHVITLGNPGSYPTVTTINPIWFARTFANDIVLPDGKVFITSG
jgi:galactose oxidase